MLDPMTAAPLPAVVERAVSPEWVTAIGQRTWQTQAEAEAASMAGNILLACSRIREAAADPALLMNRQFTEELDAMVGYLKNIPEILTGRAEDRRPQFMREMGFLNEFGTDERAALALVEEVAGRLDLVATVEALDAAQRLLPERPEPEVDPAQVAMLDWIKTNVAPHRYDGMIKPVELEGLTGASPLTAKMAALAALDESTGAGDLSELEPRPLEGGPHA